jgi:Tol biopolymer transport system component
MTRGTAAVAAVAALAVVFTSAGFGSWSVFRNAGITFMCPNAICVVNTDGSGRAVFVQAWYDGSGDPSWTRDGDALAYYVEYSDTSKITVFSSATRRAAEFGSGFSRSSQPSWSPDASSIAVREEWGGFGLPNPEATIKILSVATNRYAAVTKRKRHSFDSQPAWSPDGRTIAFVRQHFGGRPMIYLVRTDGTGERPLTPGFSPSWSPAGTRLALTLGDSIYVIRADGSGRRRILGGLRHPIVRWSPDGQKFLYTSMRHSGD